MVASKGEKKPLTLTWFNEEGIPAYVASFYQFPRADEIPAYVIEEIKHEQRTRYADVMSRRRIIRFFAKYGYYLIGGRLVKRADLKNQMTLMDYS